MRIFNRSYLKTFIFEQKCIPCRVKKQYYLFRNKIFNINTKKYWDNVWLAEANNIPEHRFHPLLFEKIVSMVPCKSKILELGCGLGILLEKLKNNNECGVFGIDFSEEAIDFIRSKKLQGMTAKVPPINLSSNSFDVAIAIELLEHINNQNELLREMYRVTKPNGFLIIAVPDNTLHPDQKREHVSIFDERKLYKLMLKLKLKEIEIVRIQEKEPEKIFRLIVKGKK
ncbi:MAG: class I SAM-dependent methyltransferase [Candidatus Omnitrophota bacterium]|nr:class I SAM-dependent methyltransferase [Candidatus Omnitrophota bacterium]